MKKIFVILSVITCIPFFNGVMVHAQEQASGAASEYLAPDPEDEDYVVDTVVKHPRNLAKESEPKQTNVMDFILENRYRGYNKDFTKKWYDHLYIEAGAGFQSIINESNDYGYTPMTMVQMSLGKTFTPLHSLRGSLYAGMAYQKYYEKRFYKFGAKLDYLFNLSAYSVGYDPSRMLEIQFLIGGGVQYGKRIRKPHNLTPEAHTGLQFKFFTGPYGYINMEPYVGMTTNSADYNIKDSWKRFDIFYGLNINFSHYFNNNYSPRKADDSMRAPMFFEITQGAYVGDMGSRSITDVMGQEFQLSIGKWFTPAIGLRGTYYHNNYSISEGKQTIKTKTSKSKYGVKYYSNRAGIRIDALVNPFGLKKNFDWDSSAGAYLVGGLGYGWLMRYSRNNYHLVTPVITYSGGVHLWKKLDKDLQFFIEPRYTYMTYNAPYKDNKYFSKEMREQGIALDLGVTINLRTARYRRQYAQADTLVTEHKQPKTPFSFGIAGMLPTAESHYMSYNDMTGVSYGFKAFGQYKFTEVSSARLNVEYLSLYRASVTRYTDKVEQDGYTSSRNRTGLMGYRNGLLITTANYVADATKLIAGHSAGSRRRNFQAEMMLGAGATFYLSRTAELWSEEKLADGHEAVIPDHEASTHLTLSFAGKLTYNVTSQIGVFVEPTIYLIDGLKMPGYLPVMVGDMRMYKSIGLGVQYHL